LGRVFLREWTSRSLSLLAFLKSIVFSISMDPDSLERLGYNLSS